MAKRSYKVVDSDTARTLGLNPSSEYHKFALVATIDEKLDTFVAWGYNGANLQVEADKRNGAFDGLVTAMSKTMTKLDKLDADAAKVETDGTEKPKRGRKPNAKVVPSEDALDDAIPLDSVEV
jgi:hypothetical protein